MTTRYEQLVSFEEYYYLCPNCKWMSEQRYPTHSYTKHQLKQTRPAKCPKCSYGNIGISICGGQRGENE